MFGLKKSVLAVLAISSTSLFAGTMGPICNAINATIPCEHTGWSLGGQALYLHPSSGIAGADSYRNAPNGPETSLGTNSKWSYGFQLEADYRFSTGNDFNLNWYHFRNDTTATLPLPVTYTNTFVHAPLDGSLNYYKNLHISSASNNVNFGWDQVNMEIGKHLDLGNTDYIRLHGGLNFSRVAGIVNSTLVGTSIDGSNTSNSFNDNDVLSTSFNGLGARIGLDLTHELMQHLDIYADGALSILAGTNHTSYNISETNTTGVYNSLISATRARAVPELDAKIGASFGFELAQGNLNINAGWLWAAYMNTLTCKEHNFNVQGVFFGLKWDGNIA